MTPAGGGRQLWLHLYLQGRRGSRGSFFLLGSPSFSLVLGVRLTAVPLGAGNACLEGDQGGRSAILRGWVTSLLAPCVSVFLD